MKIVIDIPDEIYKDIESRDWKNTIWARDSLMRYIHEGVVLPEHHGRLIDADAYREAWFNSRQFEPMLLLDFAPTILEADEEVQECQPDS